MDKACERSMKELERVIKFVLSTSNLGLKVQPKMEKDVRDWEVVVFTDSDWAGDEDTRISVSGFVIFLMEVPIFWRSRGQKSVALSSSEAEFYALSEAAKEVKFVVQLLCSMEVPVKLPVIVRVDNVGAIFMTENVSTSSRTKHVDIRYHFVREFVEEGFLKIIFVKTVENVADGFTKNIHGDAYRRHLGSYVMHKEDVDLEKDENLGKLTMGKIELEDGDKEEK